MNLEWSQRWRRENQMSFSECEFTFSSSALKKMSLCFKNLVCFYSLGEVVYFELYWSDCAEAVGIKLNKFLKLIGVQMRKGSCCCVCPCPAQCTPRLTVTTLQTNTPSAEICGVTSNLHKKICKVHNSTFSLHYFPPLIRSHCCWNTIRYS